MRRCRGDETAEGIAFAVGAASLGKSSRATTHQRQDLFSPTTKDGQTRQYQRGLSTHLSNTATLAIIRKKYKLLTFRKSNVI
jgi:hypothetical protein